MDINLSSVLERAEQFARDLDAEYDVCLRTKALSPTLQQLTHDVAEKLSSALDRAAFRYWSLHVRPTLTDEIAAKAERSIYFPAPDAVDDLQSQLGKWRMKDAGVDQSEIVAFLQAFIAPEHQWLRDTRIIANEGKHVGLTPQRHFREERVFAERGGAQVSWNPAAVRFGAGVHIAGVPVSPQTQMPEAAPGMLVRHEVYTGFIVEKIGQELKEFLKAAVPNTRLLVTKMSDQFGL